MGVGCHTIFKSKPNHFRLWCVLYDKELEIHSDIGTNALSQQQYLNIMWKILLQLKQRATPCNGLTASQLAIAVPFVNESEDTNRIYKAHKYTYIYISSIHNTTTRVARERRKLILLDCEASYSWKRHQHRC